VKINNGSAAVNENQYRINLFLAEIFNQRFNINGEMSIINGAHQTAA